MGAGSDSRLPMDRQQSGGSRWQRYRVQPAHHRGSGNKAIRVTVTAGGAMATSGPVNVLVRNLAPPTIRFAVNPTTIAYGDRLPLNAQATGSDCGGPADHSLHRERWDHQRNHVRFVQHDLRSQRRGHAAESSGHHRYRDRYEEPDRQCDGECDRRVQGARQPGRISCSPIAVRA